MGTQGNFVRSGMLALLLPNALSFELSLMRSRLTAQTRRSPSSLIMMKTEALPDSPTDLDDGSCYLIDTDEGRKYVCTDNPQELAWMLGIDEKELTSGPKPDDLELVECHEDWSHTGTPQWACSEDGPREDEASEASATRKFQPLRMLTNPLRKKAPQEAADSEAA